MAKGVGYPTTEIVIAARAVEISRVSPVLRAFETALFALQDEGEEGRFVVR